MWKGRGSARKEKLKSISDSRSRNEALSLKRRVIRPCFASSKCVGVVSLCRMRCSVYENCLHLTELLFCRCQRRQSNPLASNLVPALAPLGSTSFRFLNLYRLFLFLQTTNSNHRRLHCAPLEAGDSDGKVEIELSFASKTIVKRANSTHDVGMT